MPTVTLFVGSLLTLASGSIVLTFGVVIGFVVIIAYIGWKITDLLEQLGVKEGIHRFLTECENFLDGSGYVSEDDFDVPGVTGMYP